MPVTNLFNDDDPTIVNRYLAGQLTEAERAAFEADLESDAATLRELEGTARLKVGLERLRETGELDALLRPTSTFRQILVGLAATLTIAIIGMSFLLGYFRGHSTEQLLAAAPTSFVDKQGSALSVATTLAVFRKRAGDSDAVIDLPPERHVIALRVLPQSAVGADRFRVSLARMQEDGSVEPSPFVTGLEPADDGFVTVFADSERLSPGRYRLTVSSGATEADPVAAETFVLNVVRGAGSPSN